jgi:transcription-repair coupling factor (superfamily II helicase)
MSIRGVLPVLRESAEFERGLARLQAPDGVVWVEGLAGNAKWFLTAALARELEVPCLIVTANEEGAERIAEDLPALGFAREEVGLYPAADAGMHDLLPEKKVLASSVAPEQMALGRGRLAVLEGLASGGVRVVVAPIQAALRRTIGRLSENQRVLRAQTTISLEEVTRWLSSVGYERAPMVEAPGQFAVRGGLLDIYPSTRSQPVRVELFGDEIESLREFDTATQRSLHETPEVTLVPAAEEDDGGATLLDHLPDGTLLVLDEPNHIKARWDELQELARKRRELAAEADEVLPEHLDDGRKRFLPLEQFIEGAARFRLLCLTLLAHSIADFGLRIADTGGGTVSVRLGKSHTRTGARLSINSGVLESVHGDVPELANRFRSWLGIGHLIVIASDQPHRLAELLAEQQLPVTASDGATGRRGDRATADEDPTSSLAPSPDRPVAPSFERSVILVTEGHLSSGFRLPGVKLDVVTDAEVFGERRAHLRPQPVRRAFKQGRPIMSLLELKEGDLVVHVSHGIGRYRGLVRMNQDGIEREFLRIDYADPDRLYVPSDQLDRVQKYIGSDEQTPTIHRLGGGEWFRTKAKVKARVKEMAKELLQLYAARQALGGHAYGPDTVWQSEMEAAFAYQETPDQLTCIRDVKVDLEKPLPMDRLICGDVGFGKTEVAIRAAFKVVTDGKQAAVLVPTTVLAQQHLNTFSERLAAFPVKVEMLSRFRTRNEQKKIVEGLANGTVDIVIGTHRLLSKDVEFRDLGLLIVDEEQRFGVAHKEKLKQMRKTVDVLTLSATPIPRTLHMSLSGIRDMSLIEDPPEGRLAVRTFCLEADDHVVREAVLRELDRGGQVYYLHNRIETIYEQADRLQQLVPQARIRVGHGQMPERDLEEVMLDFYDHEFDILVCTTIIESGLDIPRVNTIIVNDADHLGLSQLHQLRGRVGRSSVQAYCYLLYKPFKQLTEVAEKRLQALRDFTDLGAGFKIALRDMEIRGAGNLLGGEQHGFMISVGFDLYCQMIAEAVKELQGQVEEEILLPGVSLPLSAFVPHDYIPTEGLRIAFYRKIAACRELQDVDKVQEELEDRFGDPPKPVWNLLALMRLRMNCVPAGVGRIEHDKETVTLWMARRVEREEARELFRKNRRTQVQGERVLLYYDAGTNPLRPVEQLVEALKARGGRDAAGAVQRQLAAANMAEAMATGVR